MEHIVIHSAESLHGRLQRGRGCAARRASATAGAGELVYDCVCRDPRWDALESRGLYYARLMFDLELEIGPLTDHLFDPRDRRDTDEDRTNLTIDVLASLVRLGRREAAAPLRAYAAEGSNWCTAVQALLDLDDPALAEGMDEIAVSRWPEGEPCGPGGAAPRLWARHHPRVPGPRGHEPRTHDPRAALTRRSDADLAELARARGEGATAAILELGRRRSPLVLDLAEELLPVGEYDGPLCRAVRDLGPGALYRARLWAREMRPYQDVAVDVLAAHGTGADAAVLFDALDGALAQEDWDLAAVPVDGLGRLRRREAIPLLLFGWEQSDSSQLRTHLLGALNAIDPHVAEPYLIEALWDCEPATRRVAATAVPLDGEACRRLRRLCQDDAEETRIRSAAASRLAAP